MGEDKYYFLSVHFIDALDLVERDLFDTHRPNRVCIRRGTAR